MRVGHKLTVPWPEVEEEEKDEGKDVQENNHELPLKAQ